MPLTSVPTSATQAPKAPLSRPKGLKCPMDELTRNITAKMRTEEEAKGQVCSIFAANILIHVLTSSSFVAPPTSSK